MSTERKLETTTQQLSDAKVLRPDPALLEGGLPNVSTSIFARSTFFLFPSGDLIFSTCANPSWRTNQSAHLDCTWAAPKGLIPVAPPPPPSKGLFPLAASPLT